MSFSPDRWPTHWDAGHNWALVLAAGEGTRLQALTTTASGVAVPKQFCSLGGGPSLLHDALQRARAVAPPERICAVVAEQHHRWWQTLSSSIPTQNIVVQPRNRGTANGILLPLLQILHRDADASLLVLPSDHYVRNETMLAESLQQAVAQIDCRHDRIILLGLTPEEADCELGYVVPAVGSGPGAQRGWMRSERSSLYIRSVPILPEPTIAAVALVTVSPSFESSGHGAEPGELGAEDVAGARVDRPGAGPGEDDMPGLKLYSEGGHLPGQPGHGGGRVPQHRVAVFRGLCPAGGCDQSGKGDH